MNKSLLNQLDALVEKIRVVKPSFSKNTIIQHAILEMLSKEEEQANCVENTQPSYVQLQL